MTGNSPLFNQMMALSEGSLPHTVLIYSSSSYFYYYSQVESQVGRSPAQAAAAR